MCQFFPKAFRKAVPSSSSIQNERIATPWSFVFISHVIIMIIMCRSNTCSTEPCNKRSFDVLLISPLAVLSNMYIVVFCSRKEETCCAALKSLLATQFPCIEFHTQSCFSRFLDSYFFKIIKESSLTAS